MRAEACAPARDLRPFWRLAALPVPTARAKGGGLDVPILLTGRSIVLPSDGRPYSRAKEGGFGSTSDEVDEVRRALAPKEPSPKLISLPPKLIFMAVKLIPKG